ncbi:MAG: metallophosphoesterase [Crocinitomicaceae bacterium]|nr:metallophosphoesterase [Crocinitomicaceae bacterium]
MNEPLESEQPEYTFAVAGHVYGHSQRFTGSLYPPFSEKIKQDISDFEIDFLVLTGDAIAVPDSANWEEVNDELNELGVEWFLAPGNHDYGPVRQQITGKLDFFSFQKNRDFFLILNTTNPGWTVDSV